MQLNLFADERLVYEQVNLGGQLLILGARAITGDREAREFCVRHHYSRTYPSARCRVGLYSPSGSLDRLVGVAVFSVPSQSCSIPKWLGVSNSEGVELGRLVVLDDIGRNAESWFLRRAFKVLRKEKPEVRRVVSYADPMPKSGKPCHLGTIYQASNARFLGMSSSVTELFAPCGTPFSPRTLSKLRNSESGAGSARELLASLGAPRQWAEETNREYAARVIQCGFIRRVKHPGKFVYGFGLTKADRRALPPNPEDYPKTS